MKQYLNEIERMQKIAGILKEEEAINDWIISWSNNKNSSVDAWGSPQTWNKIKKAVDAKKKIKVVHSAQAANKAKSEGYTILAKHSDKPIPVVKGLPTNIKKEGDFEAIMIK